MKQNVYKLVEYTENEEDDLLIGTITWRGKDIEYAELFGNVLTDMVDVENAREFLDKVEKEFRMNELTKPCLIHILDEELNIPVEIDQNMFPMPRWAVKQVVRSSGLVEDICEHGIGHPNKESLRKFEDKGILGYGIHACDGCCAKKDDEE